MESLGNPFELILWIICGKYSASLIKGAQICSMNLDNSSIVVLQPVVNSVIGFFFLGVLYSVEFVPV